MPPPAASRPAAASVASPAVAALRYPRLDLLRALAMVWMAVFHFCFDLDHFGLIQADFLGDPFWLLQRTAIVSLFLCCAGLGQAVALDQQQPSRRFWRRWAQVLACALLVSLGSAWMFPRSFIHFGVLHGLALMLLLARGAGWRWPGPRPLAWGLVGLLMLLLPWLVSHPLFDSRWTSWVGLVTHKPVTEDFVPLLPWGGAVCWGVAAGQWLLARRPAWLAGPVPGWTRPLVGLGRWPLSFYMLHQPLLIGGVLAWLALAAG